MILYFTGTGNSRYIAEYLGKALEDEVINLFDMIRSKSYGMFKSEKPFVIVCPTYAWQMPRLLRDYLLKSSFKNAKDIYFVLSCGSEIGNAEKYLKLFCEEKKLNFKGVFQIVMPENYILMFNTPEGDEAKSIIKAAASDIDRAAICIAKGLENHLSVGFVDRLYSGIVNKLFYAAYVKDSKFRVLSSCNSCGLCEKLCPLGNIKLSLGVPVWMGNCTHCCACISHCPKEAIEYGKSTVGKTRYTFPKL